MKPQTFAAISGLLLAVAALLLLAGKPQAPPSAPPLPVGTRLIRVTGEGEVRVKPDIAYISFGIRSEGASAAEVEALNVASANSIVASLIDKFQMAPDDVKIARLVLEQVMGQESGGVPRVTGYKVATEGLVVVRNPRQVPAVLDRLVQAGATTIHQVSYALADPEKARQTAMERAMANAEERAAALATAGKVSLLELYAATAYFDSEESPAGLALPPGPVSKVSTEVVIRVRVQADFTHE